MKISTHSYISALYYINTGWESRENLGCNSPTIEDNPIVSSLQTGEEALQNHDFLIKSVLPQSDYNYSTWESQKLQLMVSQPMPLLPEVHDLPQSLFKSEMSV